VTSVKNAPGTALGGRRPVWPTAWGLGVPRGGVGVLWGGAGVLWGGAVARRAGGRAAGRLGIR
jgi:hypothetical protein